jgi:hypothetical protein
MAEIEALPGRECGACNICCTVKPISIDIVKPPGITCRHCTAQGCAVYETRWDVCIGYLCGWKWAPFLAEDMRPDRSGLLFDIEQNPVDGYIGEVTILAFRDAQDFSRGRTPDLIAGLIRRGVSVQLSRPGPPGMLHAKTRINRGFAAAVQAADQREFFAQLLKVVQALDNHAWELFLPPDQRPPRA